MLKTVPALKAGQERYDPLEWGFTGPEVLQIRESVIQGMSDGSWLYKFAHKHRKIPGTQTPLTGGALFAPAIKQPEYDDTITQEEANVITDNIALIRKYFGDVIDLVELGPGTGEKTLRLLNLLGGQEFLKNKRYLPVEISEYLLGCVRQRLIELVGNKCIGQLASRSSPETKVNMHKPGVFCIGGSLGNESGGVIQELFQNRSFDERYIPTPLMMTFFRAPYDKSKNVLMQKREAICAPYRTAAVEKRVITGCEAIGLPIENLEFHVEYQEHCDHANDPYERVAIGVRINKDMVVDTSTGETALRSGMFLPCIFSRRFTDKQIYTIAKNTRFKDIQVLGEDQVGILLARSQPSKRTQVHITTATTLLLALLTISGVHVITSRQRIAQAERIKTSARLSVKNYYSVYGEKGDALFDRFIKEFGNELKTVFHTDELSEGHQSLLNALFMDWYMSHKEEFLSEIRTYPSQLAGERLSNKKHILFSEFMMKHKYMFRGLGIDIDPMSYFPGHEEGFRNTFFAEHLPDVDTLNVETTRYTFVCRKDDLDAKFSQVWYYTIYQGRKYVFFQNTDNGYRGWISGVFAEELFGYFSGYVEKEIERCYQKKYTPYGVDYGRPYGGYNTKRLLTELRAKGYLIHELAADMRVLQIFMETVLRHYDAEGDRNAVTRIICELKGVEYDFPYDYTPVLYAFKQRVYENGGEIHNQERFETYVMMYAAGIPREDAVKEETIDKVLDENYTTFSETGDIRLFSYASELREIYKNKKLGGRSGDDFDRVLQNTKNSVGEDVRLFNVNGRGGEARAGWYKYKDAGGTDFYVSFDNNFLYATLDITGPDVSFSLSLGRKVVEDIERSLLLGG